LKREALLNQWSFSQFLECQAPLHKRKPPYRKLSSDRSESAAYSSFVHKKPNLTQMKQEFKSVFPTLCAAEEAEVCHETFMF